MHPCPSTEAWLDAREDRAARVALEAHARACPACAQHVAGLERQAAVLGTLERFAAPAELEQRVARALGKPASGAADGRLASELARLPRRTAPAVLDRLVDEALGDLPKELSRRMTAKLERRNAPRVARERVAFALAHWTQRRRRQAMAVGGALGAAAFALTLALSLGGPWGAPGSEGPGATAAPPFEVVRHASYAEFLDAAPPGAGLANALSGGALKGGAL